MPLLPISSSIDMTALENRPSYYLTYNKSLPFSFKEGRLVQVDVVKGTSQVPGENLRLGSWREKVETLRDVMLDTTGEEVLTRNLEGSDSVVGGSMTLSFRKAPLSDTFAAEKRAESARKLNTALDWIAAFQKDTKEVFNANISLGSRDDLSILHAAVYAADKNLVSRLLQLGADPTEKGAEVGSAQDLCATLADSSTEVGRAIGEIKVILQQHVESQKEVEQGGIREESSDMLSSKKRKSRWGDAKGDPDPIESNSSDPNPIVSTNSTRSGKKSRWAKKEEKLKVEDGLEADLGAGPQPDTSLSSKIAVATPNNTGFVSSNSRPNRWGKKSENGASATAASPSSQTIQKSHFASPPDLVQDTTSPLPVLPSVDWIPGMQQRCSRQAKDCPMGPKCPNAHVNAPLGLITEHHPDLASDDCVMMKAAINPQHVHTKQAVDAAGKIWWTAAYVDPVTRVVYYAERGTGGMKSKQGIYWYAEEEQATLSVKRVMLIATHAKEELSKRQAAQAKVFVPPPPPPPPPHPYQQGNLTQIGRAHV